jgi:uncharacterized membrane protein
MVQQFLNSKPIRLAISAIFTALVFVATVVFSSYVPQTTGFFNIGETMVYITAILFGPLVGAFAGGVGSMLADLFLGYPQFAAATLVIKGCEGAVVGFLSRRKVGLGSRLQWKVFTFVVGLIVGVLLAVVGSVYYSGSVELYVGIPPPEIPFVVSIPAVFWYGLGTVVTLLVALMGFVFDPEFGWFILSIIVGGLVLVSGYFLYEQLFLGVAALVEVPFNVGQMSVGLIVAVPVVRAVRRYLPSLRE